jgi:hypothetical protein
MSAHEGVSCDACGKSNFRSKRFKCLICYDYDLCSTCHEQGEISSDHTTEHPMQCILTRQDFDFYYHGERCTSDQPQSLTCPFCGDMGLAYPYFNESSSSNNSTLSIDLYQHLQMKHADDQQSQEVICPICAAMANGEPNLITADLISHITNDHQPQVNTPSSAGEGTNPYSRSVSSARDYDFGIGAGIRGGFRRGLLRAPGRRGSLGRGSGPVSQHFVVDTSSGGSGGNDPIADLLTQLSTVRRLAAANNNSSLPPSSNTINLPTLTRQQYERERLRTAGRSHHHHHHHPSHHGQQSTGTSDIVTSVENDLFDSLFSSALFVDPSNSSTNNYQTWTHIVPNPQQQQQQQSTPDQQSQTSSTTKIPLTTNTESDPSLLRRMCDESSSSTSLPQQNATVVQSSKEKSDFVQSLLLSSFDYTIHDK